MNPPYDTTLPTRYFKVLLFSRICKHFLALSRELSSPMVEIFVESAAYVVMV